MTNPSTRYGAFAAAITAVAVFCLSAAPNVRAEAEILKANIPFDFYVGTQKLPAGEYIVTRLADPTVLRIYDGKGHASVTMSTGVENRARTPKGVLVFNRYAEQTFLSEVRWREGSVDRQLMQSSLEARVCEEPHSRKSDRNDQIDRLLLLQRCPGQQFR